MPPSVAVAVEVSGVRAVDVIDQAWRRFGSAAQMTTLVRSAERGREVVRVRMADDLWAELGEQAGRLGWSVSELVSAAVAAHLADDGA